MSKLYVLTLQLSNRQGETEFVFNDGSRAIAALELCVKAQHNDTQFAEPEDDYGRRATVRGSTIECVMLRDMAQELTGRSLLTILNDHANIDHAKRAQSDPKIAAAQTTARLMGGQAAPGPLPFMPRGN